MKVVIQSDSGIWGGNEKWLVLVGEGLAARGHDVLISCKPRSPVAERARAAGLRVTHSRPAGDADLYHAFDFARMLRAERPDAVLLTAFKRSFWGGWAARNAGVQRVVERMGIERALPARWKYEHAFRHYIDALIVNSTVIRDVWLASAPWFPAYEVHVVLNGVVPPAAHTMEAGGASFRREIGVSAKTALVVAAGRLERRKGFDVLLAAFAAASEASAHLAIAGDGAELGALRAQATALGIADRVHFIGFRADLETVLVAGDVFVLPSRLEGMANVMLEAMAADCLIVATDISGVREAIEGAGWIVPVDDVNAMAAALSEAIRAISAAGGDGATSTAMREEIRKRVLARFSPASTVAHTERVLFGQSAQRSD